MYKNDLALNNLQWFISHSARRIFLGKVKGGESAQNFLSLAIFRAGWTYPLFLSNSRTIHHEESTFNLWTFVSRRSILHYSFSRPRPTAPSWFKLDVKFRLWQQQFDSCSVFSNSTLAWLPQLYSCSDIQLLYSFSTITTVYDLLRLTALGFLLSQAVNKTSKLKTINTFVDSFVLPFNITRGNWTLQPQLPFLYKWQYYLPSYYKLNQTESTSNNTIH